MRPVIFSNLRLKILAAVFATGLWFFVAGQSKMEVGFFVPLGFKGAPKDLAVAGVPVDEVEVRVAGPKLFIGNLTPSQIIAELDLSGAKDGANTYKLSPSDVVAPMGVEVTRVRPSIVEVRLERLISVKLRVRPVLAGRPAPSLRVADVSVFPRAVEASGVKKEITGLQEIETKPIDISGIQYSSSFTAPLDLSGHEFRYLSASEVDVKIIIKRER